MFYNTGRVSSLVLQAATVLLIAASASATGIMDTTQEITEHLWEQEYIPDSGESVVPLSEYDDYEVVELFRAETTQDLEAAITDGYPMPWLEDVLQDESIPWEDRYWLDCRLRAAVSQSTHTFFDRDGNAVHVDADIVFPGETYWREHMIVDPCGWNVPSQADRPSSLESWDIGILFDAYGTEVGQIAATVPITVLSRDASVGVIATGGSTNVYRNNEQSYACCLYPDGSFQETPIEVAGSYIGTVSLDGGTVAFFCMRNPEIPHNAIEGSYTPVYVYDSAGSLEQTIYPPNRLYGGLRIPSISKDGHYACSYVLSNSPESSNACLFNLRDGSATILATESVSDYNRSTDVFSFSDNGEWLGLGGMTIPRMVNLTSRDETLYGDAVGQSFDVNIPRIEIRCSNDGKCVALTSSLRGCDDSQNTVSVYLAGEVIYTGINRTISARSTLQTDVSPNGFFLMTLPTHSLSGEERVNYSFMQIIERI